MCRHDKHQHLKLGSLNKSIIRNMEWEKWTFPHLTISNSDLYAHITFDPRLLIHISHLLLWSSQVHINASDQYRTEPCLRHGVKSGIIPGAMLCFPMSLHEGWTGMTAIWPPIRRSWDVFMLQFPFLPYIQLQFVNHSKLYGTRKHHSFAFILLAHTGQTDQISLLGYYWKWAK